MDVFADLHVHTTASDGTLDLADVPAAAAAAGVDVVAITDHDRPHPELGAPVTHVEGIALVRGIELRAAAPGLDVDLLGYGVSPTPALRAELDRLQADRVERGRRIIERVETRLGVELDVEAREGIGRPHVARAVAKHPEADYDFGGAFEHLIGEGRPCYVARELTPFDDAVSLLREACGLVGLAHPLRYGDPERALALCAELDAVELEYPYGRTVDSGPVERAIEAYDLVAAGGSDAHDRELGAAGLSRAEYRRFRAAMGRRGP